MFLQLALYNTWKMCGYKKEKKEKNEEEKVEDREGLIPEEKEEETIVSCTFHTIVVYSDFQNILIENT